MYKEGKEWEMFQIVLNEASEAQKGDLPHTKNGIYINLSYLVFGTNNFFDVFLGLIDRKIKK